jgi:hypothetical protein
MVNFEKSLRNGSTAREPESIAVEQQKAAPVNSKSTDKIRDTNDQIFRELVKLLDSHLNLSGSLDFSSCYSTNERQIYFHGDEPRFNGRIEWNGKEIIDMEEYGETEDPRLGKIGPSYVVEIFPQEIPELKHLYDLWPWSEKKKEAGSFLKHVMEEIADTICSISGEKAIVRNWCLASRTEIVQEP